MMKIKFISTPCLDFFDRPAIKYEYKDKLVKAVISKDWVYELRFSDALLDNKFIVRAPTGFPHKEKIKTLKEAKEDLGKIIPLIHKAVEPGNDGKYLYLFKGVRLGFINEEDMQHLK